MPTRHRGQSEEILALDTYIKLMRAAGSVTARMNRELDRVHLTESQFGVLEVLFHVGALHQCEIAAKLLKSGGNITLVLDNLQKRGFISRQPDPNDRRSTVVDLTDEGRQFIREIFPVHAASITKLLSALTPEQQADLGTLCRTLGRAAL
jgi:MarR family 2-MHQ and catechol resistance regulon transcriptional repressor